MKSLKPFLDIGKIRFVSVQDCTFKKLWTLYSAVTEQISHSCDLS